MSWNVKFEIYLYIHRYFVVTTSEHLFRFVIRYPLNADRSADKKKEKTPHENLLSVFIASRITYHLTLYNQDILSGY